MKSNSKVNVNSYLNKETVISLSFSSTPFSYMEEKDGISIWNMRFQSNYHVPTPPLEYKTVFKYIRKFLFRTEDEKAFFFKIKRKGIENLTEEELSFVILKKDLDEKTLILANYMNVYENNTELNGLRFSLKFLGKDYFHKYHIQFFCSRI